MDHFLSVSDAAANSGYRNPPITPAVMRRIPAAGFRKISVRKNNGMLKLLNKNEKDMQA